MYIDTRKAFALNTILFDMDGTLLDSLEDIHTSANYALSLNKLPSISMDEARLAAGYGSIVLIEMITKHAFPTGSEQFNRVHDDFTNHYMEHCNDNTKPYPGIMELLAALKERGIKMAVVSNKIQHETEGLRKLWFDKYISLAIGREPGIPAKPDPAMAFKALEGLQGQARDAFFVGDSQPDIQTGKAAGCVTVGCTWGFRTCQILKEQGSDFIIDTPLELLKIIDSGE